MEENGQKTCIACGAEIPVQASICNKCSSYQAAWKNHIRYIGNVIGIFSVIAGALVFVISTMPEVQKALNWQDEVRILSFTSTKPISIANVGDGEVFVTHIHISGETPSKISYSEIERIGRSIEAGRVISIEREEDEFAHLPTSVATSTLTI